MRSLAASESILPLFKLILRYLYDAYVISLLSKSQCFSYQCVNALCTKLLVIRPATRNMANIFSHFLFSLVLFRIDIGFQMHIQLDKSTNCLLCRLFYVGKSEQTLPTPSCPELTWTPAGPGIFLALTTELGRGSGLIPMAQEVSPRALEAMPGVRILSLPLPLPTWAPLLVSGKVHTLITGWLGLGKIC